MMVGSYSMGVNDRDGPVDDGGERFRSGSRSTSNFLPRGETVDRNKASKTRAADPTSRSIPRAGAEADVTIAIRSCSRVSAALNLGVERPT